MSGSRARSGFAPAQLPVGGEREITWLQTPWLSQQSVWDASEIYLHCDKNYPATFHGSYILLLTQTPWLWQQSDWLNRFPKPFIWTTLWIDSRHTYCENFLNWLNQSWKKLTQQLLMKAIIYHLTQNTKHTLTIIIFTFVTKKLLVLLQEQCVSVVCYNLLPWYWSHFI